MIAGLKIKLPINHRPWHPHINSFTVVVVLGACSVVVPFEVPINIFVYKIILNCPHRAHLILRTRVEI